jgi:hypothetical protein
MYDTEEINDKALERVNALVALGVDYRDRSLTRFH